MAESNIQRLLTIICYNIHNKAEAYIKAYNKHVMEPLKIVR